MQRNGGGVTLTITGGAITTPADTLYVNLGTVSAGISINSQLAGTFDVVFGGSGGLAYIGGAASNTYVGTTYVACQLGLQKPTTNAPAIPGDLVVLSGSVNFCGNYTQNQIARNANVTIGDLGMMTGSGNGGTQDFGGNVTINGGTWLGNFGYSHHAFDASGIGLRFNGGRFGNTTPAGYGNYYLLTDVSYASTSTRQAVFENTSASQFLNLTEAGKGAAVRTFAITNSATLDDATPEMVVYAALNEANASEKGGLTKIGTGMLSVRGMTYSLTGDITVNGGTLVSAGSWTAATQSGTTVSGSAIVTGLSTTGGLVVGQRVTGTGIPATTTIFSIDSATQFTLSQVATASGTPTLTFAGRGGMGKAQVLAGSRTSGSPLVSGLSSTASMAVGQPVSGTGISGSILSIDSSSQITLSANASLSGTSDITFTGGSAVGSGPVTVNSGGTLMGDGIAGNVTVNSGGTLIPGTPENPMGSMAIGGNLDMSGGGTVAFNISGTAQNTVVVKGNAVLGGTFTVNPVNGYRLSNDASLNLLTVTGTVSGQFTSVTTGYEVKVVGNQLVLSRKLKGVRYNLK